MEHDRRPAQPGAGAFALGLPCAAMVNSRRAVSVLRSLGIAQAATVPAAVHRVRADHARNVQVCWRDRGLPLALQVVAAWRHR
jgi:hypothetical protein